MTTNVGLYKRSSRCTISGNSHVHVSNKLEIAGTIKDANNLITISAASGKRHFYVHGVNSQLTLSFLKLVGGNIHVWGTNVADTEHVRGGSIYSEGKLALYYIIVTNNSAYRGGAIFALWQGENVFLDIYNSSIVNNTAMYGSGLQMERVVAHILGSNISNNHLSQYYGGLLIKYSNVDIQDSIIANNKAIRAGAGLAITGKTDGCCPSNVNLTRCIIKNNRVTSSEARSDYGGGGLVLGGNTNTIIRESSFVSNNASNNHGHHIYVGHGQSISIINTHFSDKSRIGIFYEPGGMANWTTCASALCTEPPFIGQCTPVNKLDKKFGVKCSLIGCALGTFYDITKTPKCQNCPTGKYAFKRGNFMPENQVCKKCPKARYANVTGLSACTPCPGGKYGTGLNGSETEKYGCAECPRGKYGNVQFALRESIGCAQSCPGGKFGSQSGANTLETACKTCPSGQYSNLSATIECIKCGIGKYSIDTGNLLESACTECTPGYYNSKAGENKPCKDECPVGFYCENGILNPCSRGRYGRFNVQLRNKNNQDSACEKCPSSKYGVVNGSSTETIACHNCPAGRYGDKTGEITIDGGCGSSCPSGQYLDPESNLCIPCPIGAYCPGATDIHGVIAKTGYWRVPNSTKFVKCLNPCACLGALNPGISGCSNNKSIGTITLPEGCNTFDGYREGSRLCADCMRGYSRDGIGKCTPCYKDKSLSIGLFILLTLVIAFFLVFLVWTTVIKRGGAVRVSDGVKKIFISFLQLTSLATTMNIPWPTNYRNLFRIQSTVASVGEAFLDARCALYDDTTTVTIADVEYMKTIGYGILPLALIIFSVFGWILYGSIYKIKPEERKAMTVGTIVLLLYLIYPSVTSRTLALWKCNNIEHVGNIFLIDPETLCTDDKHRAIQYTIGVSWIILYVVGLPCSALALLYKFRNKLNEPRTRIRFGTLYDGFSREHYMHEGWVALRKFLLILIGIFSDKLQVILALGVVGILLVHTVWSQPFDKKSLTKLEILLLLCSFLTLWVGGIFVVYPDCIVDDAFTKGICGFGEIFVLTMNIICVFIGMAAYFTFAWMDRKDVIKGILKIR